MKNLEQMEEYFWHWYPNEITWDELRKINDELYCELQNIGLALVLMGKIKSNYLK